MIKCFEEEEELGKQRN